MLTAQRLRKKPRHFHNFTGLTPEQFAMLLVDLTVAYEQAEAKRIAEMQRQRAAGGGRKAHLSLAEKLLVTLMYLRLYLTQPLLSYLFGLDASNISRTISSIRPLLAQVLPVPVQESLLAERAKDKKPIATLEELLEKHPEFREVLVDATEQELRKPKDKLQRRQRYSGKKQRHTAKTQVTTSQGLVLHLSRWVPGRVSDLLLLRASGIMHEIAEGTTVYVDRGYEGLEDEYPEVSICKPIRGKRNHALTSLAKVYNQVVSRLRIAVEHTLAHLKRFWLLAGIYRGRDEDYDENFLVISGLHNFRRMGRLSW